MSTRRKPQKRRLERNKPPASIAVARIAAQLTPEQLEAIGRIRVAKILGADRATLEQMTREVFPDAPVHDRATGRLLAERASEYHRDEQPEAKPQEPQS